MTWTVQLCLIVHRWVTMLLADASNEEKTIVLGLLLLKVGPFWDACNNTRRKKEPCKHEKTLRKRVNGYFEKIDKVATNAGNSTQACTILKVFCRISCSYCISPLTMTLGSY